MDDEGLVDLFYEAGLTPSRWRSALSALATRFGGSGAVLVAQKGDAFAWTSSVGFEHVMRDYVDEGWAARSDRIERCARLNRKAFITENDLYGPEELRADPALEGFFLPRGIGSEYGTLLRLPTGDVVIATVQRPFGAPPQDERAVATAAALRPHLARAAMMSARVSLDRSRGAVDALAGLGLPAAALSSSGRVIAANDLFAALGPDLLRETRGRLTFTDRSADAGAVRALAALAAGVGSRAGCSIPIAARDGAAPAVAHLIPVTGAGCDVFVGAACVLLLTRAAPKEPPDAALLATLYGLTPAEAQVARSVVRLGSVPAAAEAADVSRETVKSHLRKVLAKTGVASQQGLSALLSSLAADSPVERGM